MTAGVSTVSITGAAGEDMAQPEPAGVARCRAQSARSKPAAVERPSSDGRLRRADSTGERTATKRVFNTTARPAQGRALLSLRRSRCEAV
jgi:hypothetical protein